MKSPKTSHQLSLNQPDDSDFSSKYGCFRRRFRNRDRIFLAKPLQHNYFSPFFTIISMKNSGLLRKNNALSFYLSKSVSKCMFLTKIYLGVWKNVVLQVQNVISDNPNGFEPVQIVWTWFKELKSVHNEESFLDLSKPIWMGPEQFRHIPKSVCT